MQVDQVQPPALGLTLVAGADRNPQPPGSAIALAASGLHTKLGY